jgi:hypothetical protein
MECVLSSRNSQQPGAMPLAVLRSPRWGLQGQRPFRYLCLIAARGDAPSNPSNLIQTMKRKIFYA